MIRCNRIEHWVHIICASIRLTHYTNIWIYDLHKESGFTTHANITPPHRSRPPPTPPTQPTPPQPKHRHIHTPPIPSGCIKPKPNPLSTHFLHSPEPNIYTCITTVSNTLYNRTSWITQLALSSDHTSFPQSTYNILQQNRRTFTNYKKADRTQFTEDTEFAFAQTIIPTNIHTANRIFTNIILMADKHNIPKGKMHNDCRLFPDHIVCKITQRKNMRRSNTCDTTLKLLNEEITSDVHTHKQNPW